jgi:hypothetical protein
MSDDAVRYLLGQLSDEDRERIERAYFSTGAEFDAMLAAEDELFFDYAAGRLTSEERAAFAQRCLANDEGKRRLATAEAIVRACRRPAAPQLPAADRYARLPGFLGLLATAAALLAAVSTWLVRDLQRTRAELTSARSELARSASPAPAARPAPLVIAVALAPGLTRSAGEVRRVQIPGDAESVRLDLDLGAATVGAGRRVIIRTADGAEVWSEALAGAAEGRKAAVSVPARLFATADYEIVLTAAAGQRPITFSFTAIRP